MPNSVKHTMDRHVVDNQFSRRRADSPKRASKPQTTLLDTPARSKPLFPVAHEIGLLRALDCNHEADVSGGWLWFANRNWSG